MSGCAFNRLRVGGLFALLAWSFVAMAAEILPPGLMPQSAKPAPPLVVKDLDGKPIDLKTLRGRWVMVHFWASWCGPCRKELPSLQHMRSTLGERVPALIMVNTAEPEEQVFAFLPTVAPDLNTYLDPDGSATERWQPRGLPSTFLVDPSGDIRYLALGGRAWDSPTYLTFLKKLAAKSPDAHR